MIDHLLVTNNQNISPKFTLNKLEMNVVLFLNCGFYCQQI